MRPFSDVAGLTRGSAQVVNGNPLATPKTRGKRTGPLSPFKVARHHASRFFSWTVVERSTGNVWEAASTRAIARKLAGFYAASYPGYIAEQQRHKR